MRKQIDENNMVNVVNTALLLEKDHCDGIAIPVVILNTEETPIVNDIIEAHRSMQGEMRYQWGITSDYEYAILFVESLAPIESKFSILFDLNKSLMVIDRIIETQLLIIQGGKSGDTMATTMKNMRILIEVPEDGFKKEWIKIKEKVQKKQFKELGIKRKDLKTVIGEFNTEWTSIIDRHFK